MRGFTPVDFLPFEEWRFAWRIEQVGAPIPPPRDRERVRPLRVEASKEVDAFPGAMRAHEKIPFRRGLFREVESMSLVDTGQRDSPDVEDKIVKKWLYHRGLPFAAPVILSYGADNGVVTTWKLLIRYWSMFYYPISDDVTVFDRSFSWCLLFHHEHEFHFGSKRGKANKPLQTTRLDTARNSGGPVQSEDSLNNATCPLVSGINTILRLSPHELPLPRFRQPVDRAGCAR